MAEVGIHVELCRAVDAGSLAEALSGRGLPVQVIADVDHAEIFVGRDGDDFDRLHDEVSSVLEGWAGGRSVPLVPTPIGLDGFSLHPPAG
jgi:hypothetical protein